MGLYHYLRTLGTFVAMATIFSYESVLGSVT